MKKNTYTCAYMFRKLYRSKFHFLFILWIIPGFLPQKTLAQTIANWTFNSILTGTPGLFNTVTPAGFSTGVPVHSFNGGTEYFGENGWPSGTLNTGMYLQFSLTPLIGYQLDINNLVLRMRRSNTGSPSGSGPTAWSLRSSLDGFTTDIATGSMTHNYADYSITPGSGFINMYTTVVFRLYGYNSSTGTGGSSRLVMDNIRVNGIGYLLPVRLGAFAAAVAGENVQLSWYVNHTEKNNRYHVERSTDGINFNMITVVTEMTDAAEKKYAYTDLPASLAGIEQLFYRLRLVNNTGAGTYSNIVTVKIKSSQLPIKTVIINNQLHITGIFTDSDSYQAALYTVSGQAITRVSFTVTTGNHSFVFNLYKLLPSNCIIRLVNSKGYEKSVLSSAR
ncbi:MAG: hypothetical protein ABIQ88_04055 [Chitinophagaceae bacterium]